MKSTLVYDGDCSLCRQFTDHLKRWDRKEKFQYRPLQEEQLYQEFPQLNREACEQAIHFVTEDGRVFKGPEIIEPLSEHFPKLKGIVWMLGFPAVKTASNALYDFISSKRKLLSKLGFNSKKD